MPSLPDVLRARFGPDRAIVDRAALLAWECDGFTIHKAEPLAVVLPETTEEVQDVVNLCIEHDTPFLPRGAGTCLSGGPTPSEPAVVIELARMNAVLEISEADLLAIVQPGVVNVELTQAVHHLGLHYAPDPSSQTVCTIGGNLAENSGGPHCFKYGMTTDHVLGATVVLSDGSLVKLGSEAGPRPAGGLDLFGAFTGSEGTFGIATEIVVRLSPDPKHIETLLASFDSMEAACRSVSDIVGAGMIPAAMEILDSATIAAVEASVFRAGYPQDAAAVLLVELDGEEVGVVEESAAIVELFEKRGALQVERATDAAERKRLWKGRKGAFGAMGRLKPDLYVLDGVVPRTKLEETLREITAIGRRHNVTLTNVFHAGDGNLHPNISFDGRDPDEVRRVETAGKEILRLCVDMGGSITGEHGIGSEKLEHVPMMFTPEDLNVMERLRGAFDPERRCNPGKVLPERSGCAEVAKWPKIAERILLDEADS